jgi:hypothetical protein
MSDAYVQRITRDEMAAAEANFRVLQKDQHLSSPVVYVEASAKTGSRYAVVVTYLPEGAARTEGAPWVVSVLSPWHAAYPMFAGGHLDPSYVAEKLSGGQQRNPGDIMALTLAIRYALRGW